MTRLLRKGLVHWKLFERWSFCKPFHPEWLFLVIVKKFVISGWSPRSSLVFVVLLVPSSSDNPMFLRFSIVFPRAYQREFDHLLQKGLERDIGDGFLLINLDSCICCACGELRGELHCAPAIYVACHMAWITGCFNHSRQNEHAAFISEIWAVVPPTTDSLGIPGVFATTQYYLDYLLPAEAY